jgi:hypothetical protein
MSQEAMSRVFREPGGGRAYVAADLVQECLGEHQEAFWPVGRARRLLDPSGPRV